MFTGTEFMFTASEFMFTATDFMFTDTKFMFLQCVHSKNSVYLEQNFGQHEHQKVNKVLGVTNNSHNIGMVSLKMGSEI